MPYSAVPHHSVNSLQNMCTAARYSSTGTYSFMECALSMLPGPQSTVGVSAKFVSSLASAPLASPCISGRRPVQLSRQPRTQVTMGCSSPMS